ncbi:efflux RND transporter permease subunit [Microbacterium sp. SA39]|uniref:efflux RND transporter permease subunit n=1 Tax=Microbacterium sp. SA39 TaxID=1263625 RepID=UPI00061F34A4|nr:efflux RND transporter permease subunit [Microbacterium sp. SA39]KJQ53722.1 Swarming motility protein SwrC [Microbacterium sp. SA39]
MTFLTRASLANRAIVCLITLAVAAFGLIAMSSLRQELMPSITQPGAYISVDSTGLSPDQMVDLATEPVEDALNGVSGLTSITSTTTTGSAQVAVTWPFELDADETLRAIKAAVDGVKSALPKDAGVAVQSGSAADIPAMVLSAGSSSDAKVFAESLEQNVLPKVRAVPGVRAATLQGQESQRIEISLRTADVDRLKVDPAAVLSTLQANAEVVSAGQIGSDQGEVAVNVGPGIESVDAIGALPVQIEDGVVLIKDFADVTLKSEPAGSISRVNGKAALTIQVMAAIGANAVDISHGVTAILDESAASLDAEFVPVFDQAPFIEQSIEDLSTEGGLGLLFAVIIIFAFLRSWRSTVIAAVSIPLSLLITMIALLWTDNTLNIFTLAALTIAIGRVVDDSIVVIENINRHAERRVPTVEDIVASVKQVAGAIIASTATTIAVFLPIAFVSGVTGQLFRPFSITVTIALAASLVVALTVVPVLAYLFQSPGARRRAAAQAALAGETSASSDDRHSDAREFARAEMAAPEDRLQRGSMSFLGATHRRPVITLSASVVVLLATFVLATQIPTDFLGESGQQSITVEQKPQASGSVEERLAAAEPVERALKKVEGVESVLSTIPGAAVRAGEKKVNTFEVALEEKAKAAEVQPRIERALAELGEPKTFDVVTASASGADAGIELRVLGNDPKALAGASEALVAVLKKESSVQKVSSDISGEQPVVQVVVDPLKAAALGFDQQQIATAITAALNGTPAGSVVLDGQERDLVVRTADVSGGAEAVAATVLPVTPKQTAAAQKAAMDQLEAEQKQKSEEQRAEAEREVDKQIADTASQRSDLRRQLGGLRAQFGELQASAPVVPEPQSPEQQAAIDAETERQEQIASMASAIEQTEAGIEAADAQLTQLREGQSESAAQQAEADRMAEAQRAAGEVRGTAVRVADVATVTEEMTAPSISRVGGERVATITVTPKDGRLDAASQALDAATAEVELPDGVRYEVGGVAAEQDEAFGQLGLAMLAAIALVLLVMVMTFRNLRQPTILLIAVPFAATGAILGLLLTGTPLGLPALIGLLMLIGIVVTNAIVLLDLVNKLREGGADLDAAVYHGTRLRLRPILMTATATIFALLPMAFGITGGGVFISRPLAIVVIGGLISSTLLTLILVPILYLLLERSRERRMAKRAERRARRENALLENKESGDDDVQIFGGDDDREPAREPEQR